MKKRSARTPILTSAQSCIKYIVTAQTELPANQADIIRESNAFNSQGQRELDRRQGLPGIEECRARIARIARRDLPCRELGATEGRRVSLQGNDK